MKYCWSLVTCLIGLNTLCLTLAPESFADEPNFRLEIEQVTHGKKHHFFGYIGHCLTIPWNAGGRYILAMEIDRIDRMPPPKEAATIVLIDTRDHNKIIPVDKTHAWNLQQGTMFYWNPLAAETQFFFNDRDATSGKIFTVLYDVEKRKRVREYCYEDTPIANGGVAPDGSAWLGLNYGRLARLRAVTGYPGALDWSKGETAPENDGVFKVDARSGEKSLLVSYRQMAEALKERGIFHLHDGLFINHTLWNRDSDRIFFYVRAGWDGHGSKGQKRINTAFSIKADGTELTAHDRSLGGHPEWAEGSRIIGKKGGEQIVYDVAKKEIVERWADRTVFPKPDGDVALSPDGKWFVNGFKDKDKENRYVIYRRCDGVYIHSHGFNRGDYSGSKRIDPAPRWNRTNDAILVPGLATNKTRQMFLIRIVSP